MCTKSMKLKMVQELWLQLKNFYRVITWKLLFRVGIKLFLLRGGGGVLGWANFWLVGGVNFPSIPTVGKKPDSIQSELYDHYQRMFLCCRALNQHFILYVTSLRVHVYMCRGVFSFSYINFSVFILRPIANILAKYLTGISVDPKLLTIT